MVHLFHSVVCDDMRIIAAELKNPLGVSSKNLAKHKDTRWNHQDEAGFLLNILHEGGIGMENVLWM